MKSLRIMADWLRNGNIFSSEMMKGLKITCRDYMTNLTITNLSYMHVTVSLFFNAGIIIMPIQYYMYNERNYGGIIIILRKI